MPDSRLERTRKLYSELNVRLPDTSKPSWWTEEYDKALMPTQLSEVLAKRAKIQEELVVIMRKAVLPEDERHPKRVSEPMPRPQAEQWIKAQRDEYFGPSDYYLAHA